MITIKVQVEDLEGNISNEECMFHLNKEELTQINLKYSGTEEGFVDKVKELEATNDVEGIYNVVKELMISSYGKKKGKLFIKNEELIEEFIYGGAMGECMIEVLNDSTGKGVFNFLRGIMPASAQQNIDAEIRKHPELAKFM